MGSRQRRRYADLSKPRTRWELRVESHEDGLRLDQFLAKRVKWKSRTEVQAFVDAKEVAVNGAARKSSTRLAHLVTAWGEAAGHGHDFNSVCFSCFTDKPVDSFPIHLRLLDGNDDGPSFKGPPRACHRGLERLER